MKYVCSGLLGFGLQRKTGRGHSFRRLWEGLLDWSQWLTLSDEGLVAGSQSDLVPELFAEVPEWSGRSWTSWVQCLNLSGLPGNTLMALSHLLTLYFRASLKALLPSRRCIENHLAGCHYADGFGCVPWLKLHCMDRFYAGSCSSSWTQQVFQSDINPLMQLCRLLKLRSCPDSTRLGCLWIVDGICRLVISHWCAGQSWDTTKKSLTLPFFLFSHPIFAHSDKYSPKRSLLQKKQSQLPQSFLVESSLWLFAGLAQYIPISPVAESQQVSICLGVGRHFRRIWTGWTSGLRTMRWSSRRPCTRSCTSTTATRQGNSTSLGQRVWKTV